MKTIKYFAMALSAMLAVACQGDWDEPSFTNAPYGNNDINEENIISIAQLKTLYQATLNKENSCDSIVDDVKIKGRVTGNDLGSNLYKQFALQDESGAIIVAVNQGGMHGYLAEGQEIIIDLKGLYIGNYGQMPEIGQPYNNSVGRMNKDIFLKHVKLVGLPDVTKLDTLKNFTPSMDKKENCSKLVRLEGVSFAKVEGLGTFAPDTTADKTVSLAGGCVNRALNEYESSQIVVRSSTYAKFAAKKLPEGKCNLVGIATRFGSTWQLLIRKESDIEILDK